MTCTAVRYPHRSWNYRPSYPLILLIWCFLHKRWFIMLACEHSYTYYVIKVLQKQNTFCELRAWIICEYEICVLTIIYYYWAPSTLLLCHTWLVIALCAYCNRLQSVGMPGLSGRLSTYWPTKLPNKCWCNKNTSVDQTPIPCVPIVSRGLKQKREGVQRADSPVLADWASLVWAAKSINAAIIQALSSQKVFCFCKTFIT